jgi:DNA-binding response OmpR family regulator
MKLLIVDDDVLLCSALARNLIRGGHASRSVTTVEGALVLMEAEEPAAVLTDLDLGPGGDGIALLLELRRRGSTVPMMLMTGSDPAAARARLCAAGLDEIALLEKPFEFEELAKKLCELVPGAAEALALVPPVRKRTTASTLVKNVVDALAGRVI